MFKGLKDRLKGVSEQLEDELEKQLEAQLEAELAASLGSDDAGAATATTDAPVAEPSQATDEPVEAPAPPATPAPAPEPEVPAPAREAAPASSSSQAAETIAPAPERTEAPPATDRETATPAAPPAPKPTTPPTPAAPPAEPTPAAPQPEAAPARSAATSAATQPATAAKPTPVPPVITGRKQLSEAEIEARLAREMAEAVEVQKEVEAVVKTEAKASGRFTINEDVLEDILWELEVGLLESDVALPVIEAIKESVKDQLLSLSVGGGNPAAIVEKVLRTAVRRVLQTNPVDFDAFVDERIADGKAPVVVMFVGVNGTGKTTSIARIAWRLQQRGITPVMAAGDTFRAGAIAQLKQHGETLGVKVVAHGDGADPAAVAYDAVEHARARGKQVVLLDTAGRMQTNTNLMDEMDKIRRVANPAMVVFVGDSLAGNDAVEQARKFDTVVDIDGAILTKTDVDAKGGAALSVAYTINKPLLFVGVGQDYPDLKPFDADWLVARLFGDDDA